MEKAFGEFEGKTASVIRAICQKRELPPDEDFSYVLNLISLLATRNPRMRRSMTIARRHMARMIGDFAVSNRRTYEHQVAVARKAGFISGPDVPYERMKEFVDRDEYTIEIPTDAHLQIELRVFDNILKSLGSRYWSLLVAAPEAPDFVTCDHPANLVPKQIVFPLDVRHAVIGVVENPLPFRVEIPALGVAEVNARIVNQSDRQIYARTPEVVVLLDDKVVPLRFDRTVGRNARQN